MATLRSKLIDLLSHFYSLTVTHLPRYFTYNPDNVYAVDQFAASFTGPNIDKLHKFVRHISRHTFDQYLDEIAFGTLSLTSSYSYRMLTPPLLHKLWVISLLT